MNIARIFDYFLLRWEEWKSGEMWMLQKQMKIILFMFLEQIIVLFSIAGYQIHKARRRKFKFYKKATVWGTENSKNHLLWRKIKRMLNAHHKIYNYIEEFNELTTKKMCKLWVFRIVWLFHDFSMIWRFLWPSMTWKNPVHSDIVIVNHHGI